MTTCVGRAKADEPVISTNCVFEPAELLIPGQRLKSVKGVPVCKFPGICYGYCHELKKRNNMK